MVTIKWQVQVSAQNWGFSFAFPLFFLLFFTLVADCDLDQHTSCLEGPVYLSLCTYMCMTFCGILFFACVLSDSSNTIVLLCGKGKSQWERATKFNIEGRHWDGDQRTYMRGRWGAKKTTSVWNLTGPRLPEEDVLVVWKPWKHKTHWHQSGSISSLFTHQHSFSSISRWRKTSGESLSAIWNHGQPEESELWKLFTLACKHAQTHHAAYTHW